VGRFDSTVEFYAKYREPYPAEFFREVARGLGLHGTERLLDAGCGPAPLAIGFAPYVGSVVGLDPEPEMIASARSEAAQAGVRLELIQGRIEEFPTEAGVFDLVAVGRALHWFDRDQTLAVFDRIVAHGGAIAVCSALADETPGNPWGGRFHAIRRAWSSNPGESCYHLDFEQWFAGSRFRAVDRIEVVERRQVTVADLISRALSMSTTSPTVLGPRRAAFEATLAEALEPFVTEGFLDEEVQACALILR